MTISKSHPDTLRTLTSDAHDPNRTADRHDPYTTDLETSLNNGYIVSTTEMESRFCLA